MAHSVPRGFASDNNAGVLTEVMAALQDANRGHAHGYGDDPWTERFRARMRDVMGRTCRVYPVWNGTGANVFGLSLVLRPGEAVFCPETAHINRDEGGAPEARCGCKILSVATPQGKLAPGSWDTWLSERGSCHHSHLRLVSISQATELGTVYQPSELRALCDAAHRDGLLVHMDGARLLHAAAAMECSLAAISADCGVDLLSLGGTKAGMMGGEALVLLAETVDSEQRALAVQKQMLQLPSKMRFVSAQWLAMLEGEPWREPLLQAHQRARELADALWERGLRVAFPVETNAVFVTLRPEWIAPLQQRYFFYPWQEQQGLIRLMTSPDTRVEDVDGLLGELDRIMG